MCDISGWIEVVPFTYEACPKQNEVKLSGSASVALGNIQYTDGRIFATSPQAHTNTRTQQPGPASTDQNR